jgi:hypothetical protein
MSGNPRAAFVDLLDRMLDRGVYLQADVIVTVAGVPLLGLSLRALLGGMETLLSYGIFRDWDTAIRMEHERVDAPMLESRAALWSPEHNDRRWIRGTLAVYQQGVTMRDEAGVQCLDLPYSQIQVVTLCDGGADPPEAAGCLRIQALQPQEIRLYVYHLRSLVSALSARGVVVELAGPH